MISPIELGAYAPRSPLFWMLLAALFVLRPAQAQEPKPAEIVAAKVGFEGNFAVGKWTPVTVTLRGGSHSVTGHVQLTVPDGEGLPSRVTSQRPYQLTPGQTITVMLFAKFGRIESELDVRFIDLAAGELFAERSFDSMRSGEGDYLPWAMFSGQELIVSLGPPVGIDEAIRLHRREEKEAIEHAVLQSADALPTQWYGYEGVNALVLSTSQPELYRSLTATSDRLKALEDWVRLGGRLVICAGSQAPEVLGPNGPLARFSPAMPRTRLSVATLPQTNELEAYSETQEPLTPGRSGAAGITVASFETDELGPPIALKFNRPQEGPKVRGRIEVPDAPQADLPLVVRTPYGLGEVVFVAVDLDQQPFASWKARGRFVNKLLAMPVADSESAEKTSGGQVTSTGVTDLLSQLRGALDRFQGIVLVPFFIVAGLVGLYILLIGPGDYFFVKNVLKRMEMTWITFPAIVIITSGGAYLAASALKGKEVRLNQVDLVDIVLDEEHPLTRGTSWLNLFSPRADAYDFSFRPKLPGGEPGDESDADVLLSWLGLPGSALGGMDPKTANPPLTDRPYEFSPDLSMLRGLPIHVWSTRSLTSQWSSPNAAGLKAVDITVRSDDVLDGQLTNELGVPLDNCWLAYERWVYPLERIEPGQTIELEPRWKDREVLLSRLTRNRLEYDEVKKQHISVASPYDPDSFDVPMILREMMFYQASGGYRYAGLLNRYQHVIDLSGHLNLHRAVLIGFSDQPAAELKRSSDGGQTWTTVRGPEDRHWTCYRFVIPVRKTTGRPGN